MAYYSNGTEGDIFDCANCKLKDYPCPIFYVQITYNYDAVNNETATGILNELVPQGKRNCSFYEIAKDILFKDDNQLNLFNP